MASIGVGYQRVWAYSLTAGAPAEPPRVWPANTRFQANAAGPTVVMLVHPRCPCTRASLAELAVIASRAPQMQGYVFFLRPTEFDGDWAKTSAWRTAAKIPGLVPVIDDDGTEAARFGARTSGQVVVYDRAGGLAFTGGITPSRGHIGESAGHARLLAALGGERGKTGESAVFGCALQDEKGKKP